MTDFETPDQQFLDLSDIEIPSAARGLEALKADVEKVSIRGLDQLSEYCRNHNIDFASWAADELDEDQLTKIGEAFGKVLPGVSIVPNLSKDVESEEYIYTKQVLDQIVDILVEREQQRRELFEGREKIGDDATAGVLMDVVDKYKGAFVDHPILAGGALLVAGLCGYHLIQTEFTMPFTETKRTWFKDLAVLGGIAWAGNFLTDAITDKSIVEHVTDLISGDDDGEEVEGQIERLPLDADAKENMKNSYRLGSIPFKYFLSAYEHARSHHTYELDMDTLRNNKYGRKLPTKYFREEYGKAMYKEMEALVGNNAADFRKEYGDRNPEVGRHGYYSLHEVMFTELFPHEDDNVKSKEDDDDKPSGSSGGDKRDSDSSSFDKGDDGKGSGGGSSRDSSRASSTPRGTARSSVTSTVDRLATGGIALAGIAEFERFSADFSGSPATVMGFPFAHQEDAYGDGVTQHLLTDLTGKRFSILLSEEMDTHQEAALTAECAELEAYLRAKMDTAFAGTGLDPALYQPKWEGGKWRVNPAYQTGSLRVQIDLEIDRDQLLLVSGDHKRATIGELIPLLEQSEIGKDLKEQLAGNPRTAVFARLGVDSIDTSRAPMTAKLAGVAPFKFAWNSVANEYDVYDVDINPRLVDKLVDDAKDNELGAAFEEISEVDEDVSYMGHMVPFKREQMLADYEDALTDLARTDLVELSDIHGIYAEYVEDRGEELEELSSDLALDFDNHKESFVRYGFGDEYATVFMQFHDFAYSLDLEGSSLDLLGRKNSEKHNGVFFPIMEVWYEKTKSFRDRDELGTTHRSYLAKFEKKFKAELTNCVEGKLWGVDDVITKESLNRLMPEIRDYPTYADEYGELDESLADVMPPLKGIEDQIDHYDRSNPNKLKIVFKDGTEWELDVASGTIEAFALTNDIIEAKVMALESDPAFNAGFEGMRHVFDSMEQHDLFDWADIKAFDFSDTFRGTVDDNQWIALIDFKREEAMLHYRQELRAAAVEHAGNPAALEAEVRAIDARRGQNTAQQYESFVLHTMQPWIDNKLSKNPPERFTGEEFMTVYEIVSGFGYGNTSYAQHMGRFRTNLGISDFAGSEVFGAQEPHDVMNKFMLLNERYTGELRNTLAADWGPVHDSYMSYVRYRVMAAALQAHENGADATGTWFDNVIGSDEVPEELEGILTFEEYNVKYGPQIAASASVLPVDPAKWDDMVALLEELTQQSGKTPIGPSTPPTIEAWAEAVQDEFDANYDTWEQQMKQELAAGDLHPDRTANNLYEGRDCQDYFWVQIVHDPTNKNQYMDDYKQTLVALHDEAEMGWKDHAKDLGKWLIPGI